ncbi:MAG: ADOP family duplicated permease [Acidobacteriia bacterium]|nr:ADOP family duplicated permease [Terriglobia bacterium]
MRELLRRVYYLIRRHKFDHELEAEMKAHRDSMAYEERANFGNILRLREDAREAWGWMWIDRLGQDLSYGVRMLRKFPGFTLSAVCVLALGMGVNIGAFHLLNAVYLKPLPVRDPDTIYRLVRYSPRAMSTAIPYPDFEFYRQHSGVFSALMARVDQEMTFGQEGTERVRAQFVSANYFHELGARAVRGLLFDPYIDDNRGADPRVVLSYTFWTRRFSSDPAVIGTTITINNQKVVVAGVLPEDFVGLSPALPADGWLPIVQHPRFVSDSRLLDDSKSSAILMYGRLKPDTTPVAAEQALNSLASLRGAQDTTKVWAGEWLKAVPGARANIPERAIPMIAMATFLVLLVLLVACGNLGTLLIARGLCRQREIAIRMAIGADRKRIVRQMLTESLLLASLGAAAGSLLGYAGARVFTVVSGSQPIRLSLDWRVILFTASLALLSLLIFGLTPALGISCSAVRASRARVGLLGVQIAGSCILVILASLLAKSAARITFQDPGIDYTRLMIVNPHFRTHSYSAARAQAYIEDMKIRLRGIPGVVAVSAAIAVPFGQTRTTVRLPENGSVVHIVEADPDYFRTMGIRILRGRGFEAGDRNVVIVSEAMARAVWPGQDALGRIYAGKQTVVGIAESTRAWRLLGEEGVELYQPLTEGEANAATLVVRYDGENDRLPALLNAAANSVDAKVVLELSTMTAAFQKVTQATVVIALALSALGTLALVLAAVGVFGLAMYTVSQRSREIGIRRVLGADSGQILRIALASMTWPILAGGTAGLVAAIALSGALRALLFGMSNLDPISYAAGFGILFFVALLAAVVPARRALRVDPAEVLRYE